MEVLPRGWNWVRVGLWERRMRMSNYVVWWCDDSVCPQAGVVWWVRTRMLSPSDRVESPCASPIWDVVLSKGGC